VTIRTSRRAGRAEWEQRSSVSHAEGAACGPFLGGCTAGPDDEPLPFDPATDARPAGPTPATTDPNSPFYEGGNPDPETEVEP